MKIVFLVTHLSSGGAERTMASLANNFVRDNIDVRFLSCTNRIFYELDSRIAIDIMGVDTESHSFFDRILKFFKRKTLINAFLNRIQPDIVVCFHYSLLKYIPKQRFYKVITSERNNPLVLKKSVFKKKIKLFKKADGVIFQTKAVENIYFNLGVKTGVVIPNAVSNELAYHLSYSPKGDAETDYITTVGRLHEQKNYPLLFESFKLVLNVYPYLKLKIFGEGPQKKYLIDYAKKLGIFENIVFMGVSQNALCTICSSCCFVMSSNYEGMPNALIEAMAIGVPCVSTDCNFGPSELIEDGVNGLLVPTKNALALAEAILRILNDKKLAIHLSNNSKSIIETHSLKHICDCYLNYFKLVFKDSCANKQ